MAESDSEGEDLLAGLSRPTLNAGPDTGDYDDDDEDDEEADQQAVDTEPHESGAPEAVSDESQDEAGGLLGADEAFEDGAVPSDLDPFRVVAGLDEDPALAQATDPSKKGMQQKQKWVPKNHVSQRKLFVGGVPYSMNDTAFLKFFSRYGKVQEATVVSTLPQSLRVSCPPTATILLHS